MTKRTVHSRRWVEHYREPMITLDEFIQNIIDKGAVDIIDIHHSSYGVGFHPKEAIVTWIEWTEVVDE